MSAQVILDGYGWRWEPVYSSARGHRVVVYWRLRDSLYRHLGYFDRRTRKGEIAYADRDTAYWQAGLYLPDHRLLGQHPTKQAAMHEVVRAARKAAQKAAQP